MNILYLYSAAQTYTNTVFEHLTALGVFSRHRAFFLDAGKVDSAIDDTSRFDAICVHYSIRLPFNELPVTVVRALKDFRGLKFLFIQDEYDNTYRTWHWIKTLGFQLVFTVVPEAGISRVYPPSEFPRTRFVTNLTGYVPSRLSGDLILLPPSQRSVVVGYRGRALPVAYGALGFEKVKVGQMVRAYCEAHNIVSDIEWTEEARIYGAAWNAFISSCRSMLGSESGSNVFDWDGQIRSEIDTFKAQNPRASDLDVYHAVIRPNEMDGIMNQVSPRIFEAIAARTVLVLFEGEYSGIIKANEHFIPLKKDGSNLAEIFEKLNDKDYVDQMADRAYRDIIGSGEFSYPAFVAMVDREVDKSLLNLAIGESSPTGIEGSAIIKDVGPTPITVSPIRTVITTPSLVPQMRWEKGVWEISVPLWLMWKRVPGPVRALFRPVINCIKRGLASRGQ